MNMRDKANKQNRQIIIIVSIILWGVSLLQGTGIGVQYDAYNRTMLVVAACFLYQIVFSGKFRTFKKTVMICVLILVFQNFYINIIYGRNFFEYLKIYMIPMLYSLMSIDENQMHKIGLIYGIGGGAILIAANYTKYFAGWDGNTVSLICFFSYCVFIASLFDVKKHKYQQRIIIYSCIYFALLLTLNSRSCILFSLFLLFCELGIIPARQAINKKTIILWLILPLIIAIVVASINNAPFVDALNRWSHEHFHKSMFSGRDGIWNRGFEIWIKHPLVGTGSLATRWHNSAIHCLVGAGAVGYVIWIYLIREILANACEYIKDNIIFGTVISFLAVWLQQSVELGIIAVQGNPVIFVLLGLILARTNTLKKQEIEGDISDQ